MEWRIFWRIIFDVVRRAPQLHLEMTLWDFSSGIKRLGRSVTDLSPSIVPQGTVHYVRNRAVFVGGYLECSVDLDAVAIPLLTQAGIKVKTKNSVRHLSESIDGENINIQADVALYGQSGNTHFPVFYFPQPTTNGVHLVEAISNIGNRVIEWEISNQPVVTGFGFELETFNAKHRLRVRQDRGPAPSDVFEFLVDSIPIGFSLTTRDHDFHGSPQVFYIGATPNHMGGLFGEIAHLDFDPNGSCKSCPGAPDRKGHNEG